MRSCQVIFRKIFIKAEILTSCQFLHSPHRVARRKTMGKFIPILRVGRYKDASGRNCDITPQVLTDIVESYKSKSAPLVKGHPQSDAPAMGWIDKLKIVGNELQASFSDITEEFQHEVEQRSFKNISASFFMPLSDSNPSKGKHCLRHVGVLGASRPAIPNLGTLQEAFKDMGVRSAEIDRTSPVKGASSDGKISAKVQIIKNASTYTQGISGGYGIG